MRSFGQSGESCQVTKMIFSCFCLLSWVVIDHPLHLCATQFGPNLLEAGHCSRADTPVCCAIHVELGSHLDACCCIFVVQCCTVLLTFACTVTTPPRQASLFSTIVYARLRSIGMPSCRRSSPLLQHHHCFTDNTYMFVSHRYSLFFCSFVCSFFVRCSIRLGCSNQTDSNGPPRVPAVLQPD